ncbi:MAG: purine-nucleoside phosphorylase [Erysipelotrichaceae bacterium]|nr:purine-nucleoside phosphorylase [Erysipelotrichaceae bacterium]MBQ1810537.1 purine-nucleoside phosphorylase [Erysipelotrichaceae bacterium]MBR3150411.1 purine-nucleoside phosphorylase [Erysipelotrichaceae bacterium]MBR3168728.1 purine-nucleoside phosphorylase [Erysipelotrichaceae bacterium]MCR5300182.1 purine-nucleoside phosphorylase [Erysipelotrichaceae bacterium]
MPTPHNQASYGEIAKTVLMPGDPLRAKFIAETFLKDPVQFNTVRNMFGYTGTYEGKRVSVMGSGMGMPSIGIYSYELYTQYGVESIIRVGSCGSMNKDLKIYDVLNVTGAYSESTYAYLQSGDTEKVQRPTPELVERLKKSAENLGIEMQEGTVSSGDVFYYDPAVFEERFQNLLDNECVAAEMESFALFHNAKVTGKKAACLLTVSDSMITHEETTAEERQNSFTGMMKIALGAIEE